MGEEGVEELLARTMEVAVTLKLIARQELARVIVFQAAVCVAACVKLKDLAGRKLPKCSALRLAVG